MSRQQMLVRDGEPVPCGLSVIEYLHVMERGGHRTRFELAPAQALMLIGQLQTALRNPGNTGAAADLSRWIIGELQRYFKDSPEILEVIHQGWEEQL